MKNTLFLSRSPPQLYMQKINKHIYFICKSALIQFNQSKYFKWFYIESTC